MAKKIVQVLTCDYGVDVLSVVKGGIRIKDIDVNAVVRFCDFNANVVLMVGSNDVFPLPSAPGTTGLLERISILPRVV